MSFVLFLGRRINIIDKVLLNVRLPSETSRNTRSITERSHYKANEYRNLLFYLAFGILKDILPDQYLHNLLKYILFIRILCQEAISLNDINDSIILIKDFLLEFESIYGKKAMTSNIHGHQHLPLQVWKYGPLNKRSGFPFENKFKDTRDTFHGTKNFDGQIARNLEKKQKICSELKILREKSLNKSIIDFIDSSLNLNYLHGADRICKPYTQNISQMREFERCLILKKLGACIESSLLVGSRAIINSRSIKNFLLN